jgi:hypothetical protein
MGTSENGRFMEKTLETSIVEIVQKSFFYSQNWERPAKKSQIFPPPTNQENDWKI